jgi:hypothetical protein
MDWTTGIIFLILGFFLGRIYPLYKKFIKFIEKENEHKPV